MNNLSYVWSYDDLHLNINYAVATTACHFSHLLPAEISLNSYGDPILYMTQELFHFNYVLELPSEEKKRKKTKQDYGKWDFEDLSTGDL